MNECSNCCCVYAPICSCQPCTIAVSRSIWSRETKKWQKNIKSSWLPHTASPLCVTMSGSGTTPDAADTTTFPTEIRYWLTGGKGWKKHASPKIFIPSACGENTTEKWKGAKTQQRWRKSMPRVIEDERSLLSLYVRLSCQSSSTNIRPLQRVARRLQQGYRPTR